VCYSQHQGPNRRRWTVSFLPPQRPFRVSMDGILDVTAPGRASACTLVSGRETPCPFSHSRPPWAVGPLGSSSSRRETGDQSTSKSRKVVRSPGPSSALSPETPCQRCAPQPLSTRRPRIESQDHESGRGNSAPVVLLLLQDRPRLHGCMLDVPFGRARRIFPIGTVQYLPPRLRADGIMTAGFRVPPAPL